MLLERVSLEDKIDHLFVVNIRFNKDLVTFTQLIYNKLYCSIFEKQKMLDASERFAIALGEAMRESDKSYLCTKKTHATIFEKQFISLYL